MLQSGRGVSPDMRSGSKASNKNWLRFGYRYQGLGEIILSVYDIPLAARYMKLDRVGALKYMEEGF